MGYWRNAHGGFTENEKERDHLEDLDVDGRKVLKWIVIKENGAVWTG